MTTQARQPAGAPTGGQFAPTTHGEADVELDHDDAGDLGLYEEGDAEQLARASVSEAVLAAFPTAVRWEITTTDEYDDGWFLDESNVQVTYPGPEGRPVTTSLDLSRTPAADDLREVADAVTLGWASTMSANLPLKEAP